MSSDPEAEVRHTIEGLCEDALDLLDCAGSGACDQPCVCFKIMEIRDAAAKGRVVTEETYRLVEPDSVLFKLLYGDDDQD